MSSVARNIYDFEQSYADVWRWLLAKSASFSFAASLQEQVRRRGELSEKQIAAARRCMANDAERAAKVKATNVVPVDDAKLRAAFATAWGTTKNGTPARAKGPRLVVDGMVFKPAPLHGTNPGAIYVTEHRGSKAWLGTLKDGQFTRTRECTDQHVATMAVVLADPEGRTKLQAQLYSYCGVCGRTLTNHKSIDRGIGPICAERMGWSCD